MKIINTYNCLCPSCMEKHNILIIEVEEKNIFKDKQIKYFAQYHYCQNANEFYETEDQMSDNYAAMKQAYYNQLLSDRPCDETVISSDD